LRLLFFLGREIGGHGGIDGDLALGGAVVGEGVVEVKRQGLGRIGEAAEGGLGLAELVVGEEGGRAADVAGGLRGLGFEGGAFGSGLLAGFEVPADAEAVETAIDSPRSEAVAVEEPGNGECGLRHVLGCRVNLTT
jgi:hypothetical protein